MRDRKAAGVYAIKIMNDDVGWSMKTWLPLMKPDVLSALIDEAQSASYVSTMALYEDVGEVAAWATRRACSARSRILARSKRGRLRIS